MGEFKNSELIYYSPIYILLRGILVILFVLSTSLYVSTFFDDVLSSLLLD